MILMGTDEATDFWCNVNVDLQENLAKIHTAFTLTHLRSQKQGAPLQYKRRVITETSLLRTSDDVLRPDSWECKSAR